jgi:hypothetical protein
MLLNCITLTIYCANKTYKLESNILPFFKMANAFLKKYFCLSIIMPKAISTLRLRHCKVKMVLTLYALKKII